MATSNVTEKFTYEINGERYVIRIRKLTPLECWRLMGFADSDYKKAESVNSNTQLYKQAGNSIVKQVLMSVFSQMIPSQTKVSALQKKALAIFDLQTLQCLYCKTRGNKHRKVLQHDTTHFIVKLR